MRRWFLIGWYCLTTGFPGAEESEKYLSSTQPCSLISLGVGRRNGRHRWRIFFCVNKTHYSCHNTNCFVSLRIKIPLISFQLSSVRLQLRWLQNVTNSSLEPEYRSLRTCLCLTSQGHDVSTYKLRPHSTQFVVTHIPRSALCLE